MGLFDIKPSMGGSVACLQVCLDSGRVQGSLGGDIPCLPSPQAFLAKCKQKLGGPRACVWISLAKYPSDL